MDQLKEHLVKIKPYAFWIACAVVLLCSLGTWYTTTGALTEVRNGNKSKWEGGFSTVNNLRSKAPEHPNAKTAEGMTAVNLSQGIEIARGWTKQYDRQQGVLLWPESLGEDFHDAVKSLRPIEKVPFPTLVEPVSDTLRRRYRDFIEDELPKLATIIGGKWQVKNDPSGNGFGPGLPTGPLGPDGRPLAEVDRSMVLWNPGNQKELLDFHYGFTKLESAPETLQVLYAQEDLWVFQNLMGIIAATNAGAEGRHDAAIKQLLFMRIGLNALGYAGQVEPVVSPDAAGNPGGYGESRGPSPYGSNGPGPAGPQQPQGQPQNDANNQQGAQAAVTDPRGLTGFDAKDPANWRYVDAKNIPLAGIQLRNALATTTPSEADALLTVAKRVPVRMYFEMDQRKLSKLLAEMGNAPLPVEVRQLRVNRDPAPIGAVESFFAGAGGGLTQPGGGEGGRFSMPAGPRGGGYGENFGGGGIMPGSGPGQSITRDATLDTNLIKLEIYGIVYLYNPVIPGVLGLQPKDMPTAMIGPATGAVVSTP